MRQAGVESVTMNATFWIQKFRGDAQGLTASQLQHLAEKMGISKGALQKIITGEDRGAHSDTIDKLVALYMTQPLQVPPPSKRGPKPKPEAAAPH